MSANINIARPKKIALIAANASVSKQTGWPIGFWWAELTHPYWEFTENGYTVDIFSPEGGALQADGFSDPEDASGYSAHDILSLGFKKSAQHAALLQQTRPISAILVEDYDAVFLTGGQSPMYTFIDNEALHRLVVEFYEKEKVLGIVCHATCVLLKAKTADGKLLVDGKTWTGFADSEEQYADNFVGQRIQPFWIETEAKNCPTPISSQAACSSPLPCATGGSSRASSNSAARQRPRWWWKHSECKKVVKRQSSWHT